MNAVKSLFYIAMLIKMIDNHLTNQEGSFKMSVNDLFEKLSKPKWPFKSMKVGDVVEFPEHMASTAASAASGYSGTYNMKFKRRKDKSTGKMYIKRIA